MRGAAVLVLALCMALPGAAAAAWSEPRTIGTTPDQADLALAFDADGDALLASHSYRAGFTARRPFARRFGKVRPYSTKNVFNASALLLDGDGSALLLGEVYEGVPEFERNDYECCERVFTQPLSPGGRLGERSPLTPQRVTSLVRRVDTDGRGAAGIVWTQGDHDVWAALRAPGGPVGTPYRLMPPPELYFDHIAVRPDGSGLAMWDRNGLAIRYATVARDGTFGPAETLYTAPTGYDVDARELVLSRGGLAWIVWTTYRRARIQNHIVYAAPWRPGATPGAVRRLGLMDRVAVGVDDAGGLTVVGDVNGVVTRYVHPDGALEPLRRIARGGDPQDIHVAGGGPRRRTAVAWQETRRISRDRHVEDLFATSGQRGRMTRPTTMKRGRPGAHSVSDSVLAVSRRGEAVLAWNSHDTSRQYIRYSTLARR